METASNTERRYNTRFRGVPKSVFTYSRVGKKPGPKSKTTNPLKAKLKENFVFTKVTKKCAAIKPSIEAPNKVEVKREESPCPSESENGIGSPKSEEKLLSNGVHYEQSSEDEIPPVKELVIKTEIDEEDQDPGELVIENDEKEPILKEHEEIKSPFEKLITPILQELIITGDSNSGSKSVWITSKEKLSFNNCSVASYNPKSKMFRCIICQAVGFMSRIGEHYLGTHCNAKVFQCPQCSYCSAWWRCVRNHMSKSHGISNAPASMWKNQPLLDEIMQLLQNLKYSVDCEDRVVKVAENSGKRYICPKCPYATDRRDLYNRHENIHREEKPFQCYICHKLFNRADHVKKHFCRIHKDYDYDINLIRRLPSKRSRLPVSPYNGVSNSPHPVDPPHSNASANPSILTKSMLPPTAGSSQLLNCLMSPTPLIKPSPEISYNSSTNRKDGNDVKDVPFQKSHSNLLSYLTRSNFPSKPPLLELPVSGGNAPGENYSGKRLQEGALAAFGFSQVGNNVMKEFICPYCPWKTTDMWTLRMHTATHYNNACIMCNFRSTQETDLELHMWDCHRKRPCNKCNFLADSIIMLDAHIKEMHTSRQAPFRCRVCAQPFEIRSDMEAHCIFIHNQVLRECKIDSCDFCSTDPDVLESHRNEKHKGLHAVTPAPLTTTVIPTTVATTISSTIVTSSDSSRSMSFTEDKSTSRTQCLYCGCDFVDFQSLALHEVIFHENPLQIADRRPLDPYCCSVCGYATPKQLMMMEHLRTHTGQELYCLAGDGCYFRTPYDTVLREHVLQTHCNDDGIVRCPHCGFCCSSHHSLVSHYKKHHHLYSCSLCEEVEHKYFISTSSSSYLDSTIAALFPYAKRVADASRKANSGRKESLSDVKSTPMDAIIVDTVRRCRKQSQPRKVLMHEKEEKSNGIDNPSRHNIERNRHTSKAYKHSNNSFGSIYTRKVSVVAPLLRCRLCVKSPRYFRQKGNFVFHAMWHHQNRHHCKKCIRSFRHRYQVLLHNRREHKGHLS